MRFFTLLLFLSLCTSTSTVCAQTLSGRITDANTGEPLPYASIYVEQTKSGTASNADGYFQVKLAPGTNQVLFSYLGYSSQQKTVRGSTTLNVELSSEALELQQVEVLSSGEDLSYSVIRRAIAKADYHLNQLDSYTAEVYIKGTGKVNQIPGLIRMMASKEDREDIDETLERPFTSESTSRVSYKRPNTYEQEVLSRYAVGDEQFDANPYIFASFYSPYIADVIVSPLSPRAFGYYKFVHEGIFVDQDELINRIKVIPRSKGEDIFEGYINIVQDDWSLHSLDLTTYKLGFEIKIKRTFAEVQEHTWMPITTQLDADGKIFGFALEYHYLSTISDYELELNPELGGYVEVIDEKTNPEAAAAVKQKKSRSEMESVLADGGELTRKDMRRLMREYRKQELKEAEEPEVVSNYSFKDDSSAVVTDTAAWADIRPVPLTALEKRGYAMIDSIQRIEKEEERVVKMSVTAGGKDSSGMVVVQRDDKKKKRSNFRRILLPDHFFNPVEGYTLGGVLIYRHKKKQYGININPRYGFGWKRATAQGSLFWGKSGVKRGEDDRPVSRYQISGGRALRQFDRSNAIDPWLNNFTTLLYGNNYISLYERAYGEFAYNKQYGDRLTATLRVGYEDRRAVVNSANNNWFGLGDNEAYEDNAPVNAVLGRVRTVNPAATAQLNFIWRPGLKFEVENGRRQVLELSAPKIGVELEQGFDGVGNSTADFTRLQLSYEHRFNVGRRGKVDLLVRGGSFLNNSQVDFPDFRDFATTELSITNPDPIANYRLLPYYQESTNEEYAEVYAHYQFRKFLLTQINHLHLKGLKEDLFVNYLYTPTSENYTELGYSLDNIFRFLRVEFVTSFRDFAYEDFGVRISVSSSFTRLFNQ
ncbi:MAG: DUF5686 and carboxypeptidase regulatory-like domain-containing protein [Bacteroidota bacterium]